MHEQPIRGRIHPIGQVNDRGHINLCAVCGATSTAICSFTIDPLRQAPASSTFGRDDCSYSTDRDEYRCDEHSGPFLVTLRGYSWGRTSWLRDRPTDHCCVVGCRKNGEYEIYGESNHPDDNTVSCEEHIGRLLGSPAFTEDVNKSWTVVSRQIEPAI